MDISLMVAKSRNDVIGHENKLPWRIPEDLKLFKAHTSNKAIIMGRKTYESIGRPLPNRLNIVLTRNGFRVPGVEIVHSFESALARAEEYTVQVGATEAMIIGGAEIFSSAFELATKIYLTNIPRDFSGDAFFPALRMEDWSTIHNEVISSTSPDVDHFEFSIMRKEAQRSANA